MLSFARDASMIGEALSSIRASAAERPRNRRATPPSAAISPMSA
jgi:hypothetical protein